MASCRASRVRAGGGLENRDEETVMLYEELGPSNLTCVLTPGHPFKIIMNVTRRRALMVGGIASASIASYCSYSFLSNYTDLFADHLYPYVKPMERWTAVELTEILSHMNKDEQTLILSSLHKQGTTFDPDSVKKEVRWLASNVVTYPFRNATDYDYHEDILQWLATEFDVDEKFKFRAPSFLLERKILDAVFVQIWDKLTPTQRRHLLDSIDRDNTIQDKAGIALAGGAAALSALSVSVCFMGFAFYPAMSSMICAAAGFFGLTLPFGVYTGASSTVAVLSGPVGWAILGLAALGSAVFLGRANSAKTAAFVTQLHLIKVQSLNSSNRLERVLSDLHI